MTQVVESLPRKQSPEIEPQYHERKKKKKTWFLIVHVKRDFLKW
jgi:hypothetical protein